MDVAMMLMLFLLSAILWRVDDIYKLLRRVEVCVNCRLPLDGHGAYCLGKEPGCPNCGQTMGLHHDRKCPL